MAAKNLILVAEDESIISDTLESQLTENGMDVVLAKDGNETWEKIQKTKPDVIILDLIMPKLNGFEILQRLNESKKFRNIPVIVLSNLGQEPDIYECERLGAKEYLIKANTPIETLLNIIKKYL